MSGRPEEAAMCRGVFFNFEATHRTKTDAFGTKVLIGLIMNYLFDCAYVFVPNVMLKRFISVQTKVTLSVLVECARDEPI